MAVVQELIRTEDNGTISFGDYELNQKSKLSDYQYQGDMYKVKTYKEDVYKRQGYKSVELMKKHIAKTMRPEVLGGIGGFSGAFSMEKFKDMEEPTLVSGTDGCGTKVKVAMVMDKHDTIGIDVYKRQAYG